MIAKPTPFLIPVLTFFLSLSAYAQAQSPLDVARRYLSEQREHWQLTEADIADIRVTDQYQTKHNGLTHIYLIQQHAGIELFNAISGLHITAEGKVAFATNRFTPGLASKANATRPLFTAYQAIERAAAHLGLSIQSQLVLKAQKNNRFFTYNGGSISDSDIDVQLVYQLMPDSSARLAWRLAIDRPDDANFWNLRVDALTGQILSKDNWTAHCAFPSGRETQCGEEGAVRHSVFGRSQVPLTLSPSHPLTPSLQRIPPSSLPDAQYNVFPIPLDNPDQGSRELVLNPHDPVASPYGWHDTDGEEGAEYQITQGNNVHAYQDGNGNNSSSGDEPNGGSGLVFDFPLDLSQEPATYQDASVTQLFYLNNFMHDLAYAYGFDEPAGNFQENNYGNDGVAGDYVAAESQDVGTFNNANFTTPPDGFRGRMQMYSWNSPGDIFSVTSPSAIAGFYEVRPALFGGSITTELLTGPLAVYNGGTGLPALACSPAQNAAQLNGAVALIDRGTCDFDRKSLNAQNAGAVAVIICNYADDLVNMGPISVGAQVNIPVVSMRYSNCQALRQFVADGVEVAFQLPDDNGPARLDGSLDNVVVAHEYTHGISNRLVGGPSSTSCLMNDEQMGEGWSDFLSLAATVKPGDTGATPRTYANYVLRQGASGTGLRRQPYATDMAVNDQTYEDIVGTVIEQSVGEIWAVTLWDLYWKLSEVYDWDEDPVNGNGGNNLAIQLVMDAMKLQACDPGFIDGRDALLAADSMNTGGANACYIWEVFARRGLGYKAEQGSRFNRNDGLADFTVLPECVKELKISKSVTPLIAAGEEFTVTLTITNHKETTAPGVAVSDEIPLETVYVAGSATGATPVLMNNEALFEIGDLAPGEERVLSYRLSTNSGLPSIRQFLDDMEAGAENWMTDNLNPMGFDFWAYSDNDANSGDYSWYIRNTASANDQVVQLKSPITVSGAQPVLRFYHRYNTEAALDGGFVEVSIDGGASWETVQELILRSPYPRPLATSTLGTPSLRAYSGSSDGEWLDTYVGLSAFQDEELLIRFRFGSNDSDAPNAFNPGWYVDDVEVLDLVNYNGEACVYSTEGDLNCTRAPYLGTVMESAVASSTKGQAPGLAVELFPNPAGEVLNLMLQPQTPVKVLATLATLDGRIVRERQVAIFPGYQLLPLDVSGLASGLYVVRVRAGKQVWSGKVVKE